MGHIIGSEGLDFLQECIELVKEARHDEDQYDKRKWKYILRVMTVLRDLHRAPLCRLRRPQHLPNDMLIRNNDERPRERSRSPTTWRLCPHEPPSSATTTSCTCDICGNDKNMKKRCRRARDGAKWICSDCENPLEEANDDNEQYFTCFECNQMKLMRHSSTHKEIQHVCTTCRPPIFPSSSSAPASRSATEIRHTPMYSSKGPWVPMCGQDYDPIEVD